MRAMWKKLTCLLLALTLSAGLVLPALADEEAEGVEYGDFPAVKELKEVSPSRTFRDVKSSDWYYTNMDTLVRAGGINGYEDGTFRSSGKLRLCEFLKILTAILFPDYLELFEGCEVEGEQVWYAPYTALAEYMGLMRGVDGSKAALEARVSRYDMAKIIVNAAWVMGQAPEDQPNIRYIIGDYSSVPETYQEAVRTAYSMGILMGKDENGNFCGQDKLTRAEACTVVVRLFRESARSATCSEVLDMSDTCKMVVTMPRSWQGKVEFRTTGEEGVFAAYCYCKQSMADFDGNGGLLCVLTATEQPEIYYTQYQELGSAGSGSEKRYLYCILPAGVEYDPEDSYSQAAYTELFQAVEQGQIQTGLVSVQEGTTSETAAWDYDPETAVSLLSQYQDADIPADQRVSILTLQMEAYADFSGYGIQGLNPQVYADYHKLLSQSYHGTMVNDIFAGGTTQTEWSVLTGRNDHSEIIDRAETDSYAWFFREQGYTVNGAHPSHQWYYDRDAVNPALGFQYYLFMENYFAAISDDANVAYDDIFFPDLEKRLANYFSTSDTPLYSFNVTYQGHGPYQTARTYWGDTYCTGAYSTESRNILNNYFAIIQESMGYVTHLVSWLNTLDKPVVLLLYGDHKPWLGENNSVYKELGINIDTQTTEGFLNYYSTEYVIWANDAAKQVLGDKFHGTGPTLSPCFLEDELFTLCGWDGPAYMQAQRAVKEVLPVLHTGGWYLENGVLTQTLSQKGETALDQFRNLAQWDVENGRN